ncbi:hypothetical protein [Nitrincola alkalilacustris]|uniref:hypothetical protein n=1 Tax=Nitrincola alkalilacustris TaxID=1571224 RepID=UPI00124C68C1|nr:hypothetical protein [Nitrincola alkalilacustris]
MRNRLRRLTSLLLTFSLLLMLLPSHALANTYQISSFQDKAHHKSHQSLSHHSRSHSALQTTTAHSEHTHQQATAAMVADIQNHSDDCPQWPQASCIACCIWPALSTQATLILHAHPPTPASITRVVSERMKERLERPPRNLFQIT